MIARLAVLVAAVVVALAGCTDAAPPTPADPVVPPTPRDTRGTHVELLDIAPGDSAWQRSLHLTALQSGGPLPMKSLRFVVDPGTTAEHVSELASAGNPPFWYAWLDTALVGRHTIAVRMTDTSGFVTDTTFTRIFVTPDVPYTATMLPTLGGTASALDVNSRGDVVGWARAADSVSRPVLWRGGVLQQLPALRGESVVALRINEAGDVLGQGTLPLVWRADGNVVTLGPLPLDSFSDGCCRKAGDLNDRGQAVAYDSFVIAVFDVATGTVVSRTNVFSYVGFTLSWLNDQGQTGGSAIPPFSRDQVIPYSVRAADASPVRLVNPWRRPPGYWDCFRVCPTVGVRVGADGEGLTSGQSTRRGTTADYPVFTPPAGDAIELYRYFGPDMHTVALSRRNQLVATTDMRDSTAWIWRGTDRRTVRVAVPAAWKILSVSAISPTGFIVGEGRNVATGITGPVLLSPVSR